MITNFEQLTYEVTTMEKEIASYLAKDFNKNHRGKDNSITSSKIIKMLARKSRKWKMSDSRLRKIINYIRNENLCNCLIATSKGYYTSSKEQDVKIYMKSLAQRANEILHVRTALSNQYTKRFKKKI